MEAATMAPLNEAAQNEKAKIDIRDLCFFYGDKQGAEEHHVADLRPQGHRLHRPFGLRQVHFAARHQPHL